MSRGDKGFLVAVTGQCALIVMAVVAYFQWGKTAAFVIGNMGTLAWLACVMVWIVFHDSKRRWPAASAWQRYVNVVTFRRG